MKLLRPIAGKVLFAVLPAVNGISRGADGTGFREVPAIPPAEAVAANLPEPEAVFAAVFSDLPDLVNVLPTENYWYWERGEGEFRIRGNIRLASGRRERGELHFGYAVWRGDADQPVSVHSRVFTAADGVTVRCPGPLRCQVNFLGRTVEFRLHAIAQLPPATFPADPEEAFVQRTFDDSGLPFFLMLHRKNRHFFWVLNEEEPVRESWEECGPDAVRGRDSGFVFWIDHAHGARKVLAAVDRRAVERNTRYDGPFDQLADNYAAQTGIREAIAFVWPALAGRIDLHGYRLDTDVPSRIAIAPYARVDSPDEAAAFLRRAMASGEPLSFIASGGTPAGREPGLSAGRIGETVPRFPHLSRP